MADFTYVWTIAGFCHESFITDVFSHRLLRWRVMTLRTTTLVLSALEQSLFTRRRTNVESTTTGLLQHSDAGSENYMATVCTDWIVELGAALSTGAVGDSFDGRSSQQPLQDRSYPPARSLVDRRAGRAGDARGVVVEQSAVPRRARHAHPRRGRRHVLR